MNYDYLTKIKGKISLYTKKKTSNLLEGNFRSVYRGRSMEFDDLREYTPGDNVRDIDWKSSSRTGKMLVRRYVAEKRHNILFVADTGVKMQGDTSSGEPKSAVAQTVLGVMAFLADRNSDDFALLHSSEKGYEFSFFRSGAMHFEAIMHSYALHAGGSSKFVLSDLLSYVAENIRRRMVICVITDLDGIDSMDERLLKTLTVNNDLLIICVEDALLTDAGIFNLDTDLYEEELISGNRKLREAEQRVRQEVFDRVRQMCRRYQVSLTMVSREDEVIDQIAELFGRHRNEGLSGI